MHKKPNQRKIDLFDQNRTTVAHFDKDFKIEQEKGTFH